MGIYLSKPNTTKDSHVGENPLLRYGVSAMQGWRMNMEDAHITNLNLPNDAALFAVFDGHGGQEVARFCGKYMVDELVKNENYGKGNFKRALEETFLRMDAILMGENAMDILREFKNEAEGQTFAGCTANVVLVTKTDIYCANAGDSRCYVFTKDGQCMPLSSDHKPDVETERQRIHAAGGYVSEGRVNDNLNLTRAIGDLEYKKNTGLRPEEQIISAFPDVRVQPRNPNMSFMLIGCDGIWETLTAAAIGEVASTRLNSNANANLATICEELLDKLIAKDTSEGTGCDNMSLIMVQFRE
jgi:serine/threonine protein phosphatase PrpC